MKRYSLTIDMNMDGELKVRTYVSDQGEWVKHEDVEVELSELSRVREIYEERIRELKECNDRAFDNGVEAARHSGIGNDPKTRVECNCIKYLYSDPRTDIQSTEIFWICPAHGYKKR